MSNCRERWRNLRACLTRHIKQQKRATKGGSYHKAYYLSDHMKFLLPYTRSRSGKESSDYEVDEIDFDTSATSNKEENTTSESSVRNDNIERIESQTAHRPKTIQANESTTFTITTTEADNNQFVTFMQNASDDDPLGHVESVAIGDSKSVETTFNGTTKTINLYEPEAKRVRIVSQETDDADLNFFRSLLPDVRLMTPSQKRRFKMGIFGLLDNVLTNSDINT